jgi:hypothetical protein
MIPKPAIGFTDAMKKAYRDGKIKDESAQCVQECWKVGWRPQDVYMGAGGTPIMPGKGEMVVVTAVELVESLTK